MPTIQDFEKSHKITVEISLGSHYRIPKSRYTILKKHITVINSYGSYSVVEISLNLHKALQYCTSYVQNPYILGVFVQEVLTTGKGPYMDVLRCLQDPEFFDQKQIDFELKNEYKQLHLE